MARRLGHRASPTAFEDVLFLNGVSLAQVAEDSGIPIETLRAVRRGSNRASLEAACKIATALRCRPETLFPSLIVENDPSQVA